MTKQKSFRKIFEWIIIYSKNIARGNASYYPPTWAKSLTKFITKMQNFKRVLDLQVKGGLNNLIFSIVFQMLKI